MNLDNIFSKILKIEFITFKDACFIYKNAKLSDLIFLANYIRENINPGKKVGWIIDRNVNITNGCVACCKFCNFHSKPNSENVYITTKEQYVEKIEELFNLGGNQLLLQGGLHPKLGINYYEALFKELKTKYPNLKLHALGPPEIAFIAKKENISHKETLERLIKAGLDSLPGAGAEILSDRVRKQISKGKCSVDEWINVMGVAHEINIPTSATMMFGHVETLEERIVHLFKIRDLQNQKPANSYGFLSFIPWPFQDKNTRLSEEYGVYNYTNSNDYIRLIALCRIILLNIKNIQASWLTVGVDVAQVCLNSGANDFGSIMIEENVVSSAGANYKLDSKQIIKAIEKAGYIPVLRNQKFEYIS